MAPGGAETGMARAGVTTFTPTGTETVTLGFTVGARWEAV